MKERIVQYTNVATEGNITKLFAFLQSPARGYQLYVALRYGCLLLAALAVPKLGTSPTDPGIYELLWLLGTSVSFFWAGAWLDAFWVSARAAAPAARKGIESTAFWGAQVLSLVSAGLLWVLMRGIYPDKIAPMLALGYTVYMMGEMGSQSLAFTYLLRERRKALILWGMASYGSLLAVVALGMWVSASLEQIFFVAAGTSLLKWVFALYATQAGRPRLNTALLAALGRQAMPLALVAVVAQGSPLLDGYLVEHFFTDQFAQFRYGSKELPFVLIMANAMSLTHSGAIAAALQQETVMPALAELRRATVRLLSWSGPLTIALLLSSDFIFDVVLGPGYSSAVPVFDCCLLLSLPRTIFPQSVVRGYQHNYALTASAIFELVIKVGLSLWWMQLWGLTGLVLATVVGLFAEKFYLAVHCRHRLHVSFATYTPVAAWLVWLVAILGAITLKYTWLIF